MMYQRKSEQEIAQIKKARLQEALRPTMPLLIAVASAGLIFLFVSHFQGRYSAPLGFSKASLSLALASGLGIFLFLYAMQFLTTKDAIKHSEFGICSTCYRPDHSGRRRCTCGGRIEPGSFYEFKADPDDS